MPGIGWPGLAFGCVTALGGFLRSIFDISSFLSLGFRKSERQWPRKATAKGGRGKLTPTVGIFIEITRRLLPRPTWRSAFQALTLVRPCELPNEVVFVGKMILATVTVPM